MERIKRLLVTDHRQFYFIAVIKISKQSIIEYSRIATLLTILFVLLYGTSNWWAMQASHTYRFYVPWELQIPFIPAMIIPYMSLLLLNLTPLLWLDSLQIRHLGTAMFAATFVAFAIFMIFPAPIGFQRETPDGVWGFYYEILHWLDKEANTLPSLHITYSFLVTRTVSHSGRQSWLWLWFTLICVSVLLTHQHHLADIASGIILAEFCFRKYFESQSPS